MRILLVIDTLGSGGAQRLLANLANGLSDSYNTTILVYNSSGESFHVFNSKVNIIEIKKSPGKGIKIDIIFKIWREMRKRDIIISYMPSSNIYCVLSRLFFNLNKKLICNEVSINNALESKSKRIITNIAYIFASYIVCNTYKQKIYLQKYLFLKNKVTTILNGCDDIPFKQRFKIKPKERKYIIIGRVAFPKNGLRLLNALKLFHDKHSFLPKIEWAGRIDNSRYENNKIYREMLIFLKENPSINDNFKFVGEIKNIINFYNRADGLISGSIYEGLPYVICEAMFNGCPILASDIADNSKILGKHEEKGILCDPLSVKSIFEGLEKLVFLPEKKIKKMTFNARKFAENNLTNKKMIDQYKNLISL